MTGSGRTRIIKSVIMLSDAPKNHRGFRGRQDASMDLSQNDATGQQKKTAEKIPHKLTKDTITRNTYDTLTSRA